MSSLVPELAAVLGTVQRPGDFFASGTAELLAPMMEVDGVGPIALPLLPVQAEQLIAVAERAPYGRGEETLVDPAVRRTWQIDAGRIHIGGRHWPRTLERIVSRAAISSMPIAARTWLGFRLPDEQALPADTAMPAMSSRINCAAELTPGIR